MLNPALMPSGSEIEKCSQSLNNSAASAHVRPRRYQNLNKEKYTQTQDDT
jgi:hypothetical protein